MSSRGGRSDAPVESRVTRNLVTPSTSPMATLWSSTLDLVPNFARSSANMAGPGSTMISFCGDSNSNRALAHWPTFAPTSTTQRISFHERSGNKPSPVVSARWRSHSLRHSSTIGTSRPSPRNRRRFRIISITPKGSRYLMSFRTNRIEAESTRRPTLNSPSSHPGRAKRCRA